ncbi:MAG: F0F1 ATP synthase subunit B, partial [Actinobacteria bacterium]|nr:F0F1 ATP synthase subunit B [Actinomycetota bacterium]
MVPLLQSSGLALTLAAEKAPNVIEFNLATFLWTLGTFLVTLFILSKFAWPMLVKNMEAREVRITEGLRKAEEAETRARELAEQQEQILSDARGEAKQLIADARSAADHQRASILEAAQVEIAAERDRAKREIELERRRAIDELKATTVDL